MYFNLYKDSLDFPCPTAIYVNDKSLLRVLKMLKPFIGKKSNIYVNQFAKNKIFISNFINFCKLENINYKSILEIEIIPLREIWQIIVRPGTNQDVKPFTL